MEWHVDENGRVGCIVEHGYTGDAAILADPPQEDVRVESGRLAFRVRRTDASPPSPDVEGDRGRWWHRSYVFPRGVRARSGDPNPGAGCTSASRPGRTSSGSANRDDGARPDGCTGRYRDYRRSEERRVGKEC